jgi:hypothetical protein
MTIKNFTYSFALLAVFAFAGTASAQTATVPRLEMNANVVSAMRLDISKHASGVDVDGSAGAFSIDLGDVNALGIGTPSDGVTVAVTPGAGAAGFAMYTTPIVLTPVFTGMAGTANLALTIGSGANDAIAFEGSSAAGATLAAARVVVASSLSDIPNTRYVGFKISKLETAGTKLGILVYTMTVQ